MENKCRKVDLNMCGYVQSLTDQIEEHKETMSLDLDFKHLQRVCLGKSYFKLLQTDVQTTQNGCQDSPVLYESKTKGASNTSS